MWFVFAVVAVMGLWCMVVWVWLVWSFSVADFGVLGWFIVFPGFEIFGGWYNITSGSGLEFLGWMGVWFG